MFGLIGFLLHPVTWFRHRRRYRRYLRETGQGKD
jgi:hypothetical protein